MCPNKNLKHPKFYIGAVHDKTVTLILNALAGKFKYILRGV
jgi:hypothetical protein